MKLSYKLIVFVVVAAMLIGACGDGYSTANDVINKPKISWQSVAIETPSGNIQLTGDSILPINDTLAVLNMGQIQVQTDMFTAKAVEEDDTLSVGKMYSFGVSLKDARAMMPKSQAYASNTTAAASLRGTFGQLPSFDPSDTIKKVIYAVIVVATGTVVYYTVTAVVSEIQANNATPESGAVVTDDGLLSMDEVFDNVMTVAPQTLPDGRVIIPVSEEHHQTHSPDSNADARARVEAVLGVVNSPPPPDPNTGMNTVRCIMMMLGNTPVRYLVWRFTHFSGSGIPRGDLAWFDANGWQGAYPNKSGDTLTNVPGDLKDNPEIKMVEVACNGSNFPPPPALAQ